MNIEFRNEIINYQKILILSAYNKAGEFNKAKMSRILGINRTTLIEKLKNFNINETNINELNNQFSDLDKEDLKSENSFLTIQI